MGADAEKVRNMDKAQRIAMYIGAKTYEHIHVHFLRRKKSTLFAKFEQFMLNQAQLLCSGHAVVRLEQQFHRRLRENVMSPARISWLQDMIQSSSLNMCAIEMVRELFKKTKLPGTLNIVPSRGAAQSYNKTLEDGMESIVPCSVSGGGHRVNIDVKLLLTEMFKCSEFLHSRGRTV